MSMEQAITTGGEKQKEQRVHEQPQQEVVLTDEEEEDWSAYTNSTDLKKGMKRKATTRAQRPNPFDYRKNSGLSMDKKLDEILAKQQHVSTKDNLQRVNRRMDGMESRLSRLEAARKLDEEVWTNKAKPGGPPGGESKRRRKTSPAASFVDNEREVLYLKARRSLILGPVLPDERSVRKFLEEEMSIEVETAREIKIEDIVKVFSKRVPLHRRGKEKGNNGKVKIRLAVAHDRDVIMSHASMLKDGNSIEAVIPEHLAPLHRHLESYAYKIRKNGRNGGKKVSTSVRLQDDG